MSGQLPGDYRPPLLRSQGKAPEISILHLLGRPKIQNLGRDDNDSDTMVYKSDNESNIHSKSHVTIVENILKNPNINTDRRQNNPKNFQDWEYSAMNQQPTQNNFQQPPIDDGMHVDDENVAIQANNFGDDILNSPRGSKNLDFITAKNTVKNINSFHLYNTQQNDRKLFASPEPLAPFPAGRIGENHPDIGKNFYCRPDYAAHLLPPTSRNSVAYNDSVHSSRVDDNFSDFSLSISPVNIPATINTVAATEGPAKKFEYSIDDPRLINQLKERELEMMISHVDKYINDAYHSLLNCDKNKISRIRQFIDEKEYEKEQLRKELIGLRTHAKSLTIKGMNQQLQVKKENFQMRPIMQDKNLENSEPSSPRVHENQYTYNFEQNYRDPRPTKRNLNIEQATDSRANEIQSANTQNCVYMDFSNPYAIPFTHTKPKNFERKIEMKNIRTPIGPPTPKNFQPMLSSSERPQSREAQYFHQPTNSNKNNFVVPEPEYDATIAGTHMHPPIPTTSTNRPTPRAENFENFHRPQASRHRSASRHVYDSTAAPKASPVPAKICRLSKLIMIIVH